LQRQLGIRRYEMAWYLLRRFCRAMIAPRAACSPARWRQMRRSSVAGNRC
jgi:hypothetical protein